MKNYTVQLGLADKPTLREVTVTFTASGPVTAINQAIELVAGDKEVITVAAYTTEY